MAATWSWSPTPRITVSAAIWAATTTVTAAGRFYLPARSIARVTTENDQSQQPLKNPGEIDGSNPLRNSRSQSCGAGPDVRPVRPGTACQETPGQSRIT